MCISLLLPPRWKYMARPIPSATSTPQIWESQTHFLTIKHYGPNLGCPEVCYGQVWNWILVAWNTVICWLANRMGIQQPDRLIRKLIFKFIVDWVENSIQYWTGIIWIEVLLTTHLLLNLSCTLVGMLFILNDLFQLHRGMFGWWAHTTALLKFITMLGISQTSIWTQKYVQYSQFYSLNQNLH